MEITKSHRAFLVNYLRKQGCSHEDTQDITQKVLLKIWKGYSGEVRNEKAWMVSLARNTMITHWRSTILMRRGVPVRKEVYIEDPEELLGAYEHSEAPLQVRELERYISRLQKPLHRQLLELFLQGYELSEMADMLGMRAAGVKTNVHRAKLALLEVANASIET